MNGVLAIPLVIASPEEHAGTMLTRGRDASQQFLSSNIGRRLPRKTICFARLFLVAFLALTGSLIPAHAVPQEHAQPVPPHPATSVTKVSPTFGSVGTSVVITGGGAIGTAELSGATAVYFGGVSATFTANADGTLAASAPVVPLGVSVTVTALLGGVLLPSAATFTYQVGQLMVSGPLPYAASVEGDNSWANPAEYNAYSFNLSYLPTNGGVTSLVFPNFSPALHLGTLFNDNQLQWAYNYNPPPPVVLCPWSSTQSPQPCFSAGNEGFYSASVGFCNVSSQPPQGSSQTPNCVNWDGNTGWWLPILICPSASAPCAYWVSQLLNTSGPGTNTVGDLVIPLDALFGPDSLARTLQLSAVVGEASSAAVPSFPARSATIASTAFNVVVTPVAMVQTSAIPYTLVYAPPGNQSTVSFTTSATYGTQFSVENDQEIDNQITNEQSSSLQFSLKAAAYYLTGSVDITSGWDDSVTQGFGQVNGTTTQQQNSLVLSVTYPIPANSALVPGSGVVCATQTNCSTTTTISNPFQLEPFWGDTFILIVHPEFATYVFGNGQTRFALFGAVPVTVDATVQQLDYCKRSQLPSWGGPSQCVFEYSSVGVTVTNTGQSPVDTGQNDFLTLYAIDAANLLALDPFYGGGQSANLSTTRVVRMPSVGSPAYGAAIGTPPRPYGPTMINNTQAEQVTGKAQQTYSTTMTSVESQSDAYGVGFSASSGGGGGANSSGTPPASYSEQLMYTVGSKQTDQYTLKYTYTDSTATSTQNVTSATVMLNDIDNTTIGSSGQPSCPKCHNPLPYRPTVNIYLDRLFGSFMFQDPTAPGPPTPYHPASEAVSDLNLMLILTGQEASRNRFSDVPKTDTARGVIGFLAREQIMPGTSKGLFSPNAPITRGQLAVTLASALQLKTAASPAPAYTDVPAGTPTAGRIIAAINAGLIIPASATTFQPNDPASRQDLAAALSRGFALTATQAPAVSDAAKISPTASASVAAVVSKGYLKAFPDNTFRPAATVTREEAAQAIYMALYDQIFAAAQKTQ